MTVFDSFADTPDKIRAEGQLITLKFERTSTTTGKITWNIPPPAFGCSSDQDSVYCGIVITLDNHGHDSIATSPKDGTIYNPDPTGDRDLHAGDKIDTALVIGAFYQEKDKATKTTELTITGLKDNTPYFISGYAVDCQYRYHFDGAHAYSLDALTGEKTEDTHAFHMLKLSPGAVGTDGTGLTPGLLYDLNIDLTSPNAKICDAQKHTILIDGLEAPTYDDLIKEINCQIIKLSPAITSPVFPNLGAYYWNGSQLFQWDGTKHVLVAAIIEDSDPSILTSGEYWYDTDDDILSIRTPIFTWNVISNPQRIDYHKDPANPGCDDYWLNLPMAYVWNGDVWCELILFNQTTDPSLPIEPVCGTYWYDTVNNKLFVWDTKNCAWVPKFAIFWPDDPNTLLDGTLWFDDTNDKLFERNGGAWFELTVTVSTTEPTSPTVDQYWFNPDTGELVQRDALNASWLPKNVLVWPEDPTNRDSCDLWWDSDADLLFVWDPLIDTWNQVDIFLQQEIDPAAVPILTDDHAWFNPDTEELFRWSGAWVKKTYIVRTTPPHIILTDDVWHDTANNKWFVRDIGGMWNEFDPIDSVDDPSMLPIGTLWFDTLNNALFQWNGVMWIAIGFSTSPLTPAKGTLWFNASDCSLMEWNGTEWVTATPLATAFFNCTGDIVFQTGLTGHNASIIISDGTTTPLLVALAAGTGPTITLSPPVPGTDGVTNVPQQHEIGIGTDGTPDERRALVNQLRHQLGYPIVQVELTPTHYDIAIDNALESIRKHSSVAYKRGHFFLDLQAGKSGYILSDKSKDWHKIVNIIGVYRSTSAFLSTAHGEGVFGQVLIQQLYNTGQYDLLSYHLVANYIEQLEILFASRIVFQWNPREHRLDIFQAITRGERVLVEATFEKSEQELIVDRFSSTWIQKYAQAETMEMLARIRGKYSTYPGAGGGVSFNAADLMAEAQTMKESLHAQIDDYIVDNPEELGQWDFVIG